MRVRSQLPKSKLLVKTQRGIIDVMESDKDRVCDQISEMEANISKRETEKKSLKA